MRASPSPAGKPLKARFPELYPLWLALYVDILGFYILVPLFPFIRMEYGLDAFTVSLLLATNAVFSLVFAPVLGALSDKLGRKRVLSLSLAGTTAGFLIFAVSPSITWLFISRIVDGCFGGVYPVTRAIVAHTVPPAYRAREMANMGIVHILSSLVGPALGGILVSRTGSLLAPGLLAAGLAGAATVICMTVVKEPDATASTPGPTEGEGESKAVASSPAPTAGGTTTALLLVQWGCHSFNFVMFNALLGLYCDVHLSLNPEMIGYLMTFSGLLKIATRFTAFPRLIDTLGEWKTSIVGLATFVGSFAGMTLINDWPWFLIVLVTTSLAASCTRGPLTSILSQSVPRKSQGRVHGVANSIENVTQVFAPAAGGIVLDAGGTWYSLLLSLLAIPPLLVATRPPARHPDQQTPTQGKVAPEP